MIPSEVARRYARAVFELASETSVEQTFVGEMSTVSEAFETSEELRRVMDNPLTALEAKRAIVNEIVEKVGGSELTRRTLLLLGDRRRLNALPAIARCLRELLDAKRGLVRAEVISARPLSEDYSAKLKQELERVTGRSIVLEVRIDESLIAGVVARIGDTVYDGSLRSRLSQMKQALLPN